MEIYLVRHTETVAPKGICYGHSDVALTEPYTQIFDQILDQLPSTFDCIYTSPLQRCAKLADHIKLHRGSGLSIMKDDRLKELNFGDWELKPWDSIPMYELQPWMDDFVNIPVPSGESMLDLHIRVGHYISSIKKNHSSAKSVVVTHAGVIRSFYAHVQRFDLKDLFTIDVPFGSVHALNL